MVLDFKEIPQANLGSGEQDTFELFARDFLQTLGYKILQQPDRGADGKKDLIVQEARVGLSGTTHIKWLVSCKHHAHSGKSVFDKDEPNILDRVAVHNCDGFLGFYSTLPSTSLGRNLESLKSRIEVQTFDSVQIEKVLLDSPDGLKLSSRFFPLSLSNYVIENPKPSNIFSEALSINCECCGKNLLDDKKGIFVLLSKIGNIDSDNYKKEPYIKAYFSCHGQCDKILKNKYSQDEMLIDQWIGISDYLSPTGYLKRLMAWLNSFNDEKEVMSSEVFEKLKKLFINTFPYVAREQTAEETSKTKRYYAQGFGEFI